MFPPQYSSRRPRFSLSFSPLFYCLLRFKSEERRNKSRIREACKNVPSSPPEDLMEPPRLGADLKRGGGKKISVYLQFKTISKIASSFSFCKGAVTRLPLKCDRSTMGRDLEEVQWHYSLPDFCLLSVLPASSHTETLFIHLWTQQGWITQTYHLKLDNTKTPKNLFKYQ